MTLEHLIDRVVGQPIRTIKTPEKSLFLTFDDGPEPGMTERVLEILDTYQVKATFFVIAEKAQKYPELMQEIQRRSHGIGNHSLDHRYSQFLRGKTSLLHWIRKSETILSELMGAPTVGFRPPAGIRTPELKWVLKQLEMPMILWNTRFYDTVFPWTPDKALQSLRDAQSGTILLLHDRQRPERLNVFLNALQVYIEAAKQAGFELKSLTREMTEQK